MFDRRQFLLASAAAAAASPALAQVAGHGSGPEVRRLNVLMDGYFMEDLRNNPESATDLALDTGAEAGLKRKLKDVSTAGMAHDAEFNRLLIAELESFPRSFLTWIDRIIYDTVLFVEEVTMPLYDIVL